MIQEIKKFRASDGSDHDTEYSAWERELELWLLDHGCVNATIAATVVKRVDDGRPDTLTALGAIVAGMVANAPPPPAKATMSEAIANIAEQIKAHDLRQAEDTRNGN